MTQVELNENDKKYLVLEFVQSGVDVKIRRLSSKETEFIKTAKFVSLNGSDLGVGLDIFQLIRG